MSDSEVVRSRRRRAAPWPALAALICFGLAPAAALAQPGVKAWTPAHMDSISTWAHLARQMFRTNTGDSLGGDNFRAYQMVGKMGQNLLASLGKGNFAQAYAVVPVIDSLGLNVEAAADPVSPYFAMLFVRNPERPTADVLGFIYWWVQNTLHYQGVKFTSGHNVIMRVWRTRFQEEPYSCGVVENARYGSQPLEFSLLRMGANGLFWTAPQYPGYGPDLGGRGDAAFVDLNNDGVPELVTWTRTLSDSLFNPCRECPNLLDEHTWSEREEGFELQETRLVPSAYANFVAFIRLLREGNRAAAARLLADPTKVNEAIALGWDKGGNRRGLWEIVNAENGETWPHWFVVRMRRPGDSRSWAVHFVVKEGRWVIRDWILEQRAASAP